MGGSAQRTPKRHERFGAPAESRTAKRKGNGNTGCTRVTGRELAGKSASTKQPMAMANINKTRFGVVGSCAVVLFLFYVLRFSLTMGIVRAQYSKCHPRHFFISRSSVGIRSVE